MTERNAPRVGVIGGGLSGLGVAWRLARQGLPVTLLEKSDRTGGVIVSRREEGYLCEGGLELSDERKIERVPLVGPVERDRQHPTRTFSKDEI